MQSENFGKPVFLDPPTLLDCMAWKMACQPIGQVAAFTIILNLQQRIAAANFVYNCIHTIIF